MAQDDRRYTGDVSVFTVDGVSLLGTFKNVQFRFTDDMQEARAAKDSWRYRVGRISGYEITGAKVVEGEDGSTSIIERFGTQVAFAFASNSSGGITYSGLAWMREAGGNYPDTDGQEHDFTLEGQGVPTIGYN